MITVALDRFLCFDELTQVLHDLASARPDLLTVGEVGHSVEGRPLWLCTVTNTLTGPHHEKPAIWVDGNIHAGELTGSTAVLHLLDRLVNGYGRDVEVTRALDTRTFYLMPRLSPDGAELFIASSPRWVRSSVRAWPRADQPDGLVPSDIDGDGRILWMRVPDPNGIWKVCDAEPRLLVPREPAEDGDGTYYRLLPEGLVAGWNGILFGAAPDLAALDFNRNYPAAWRPPDEQAGAGPYPASEPEVRSVVQAMVERPNICAFIQYHTSSGVHLRPYADRSDDALPTFDLRVFEEIGARATELTGYPAKSIYNDMRYHPREVITGLASDWAYDHLGVLAWTTELWNMPAAAGVHTGWVHWGAHHSLDDDRKILSWLDRHLPSEGFVDWHPWDHPQLGLVEIGGWNSAAFLFNPPMAMLDAEVRPHADWVIWHALISPRLTIRAVHAAALDDKTWLVRTVVDNTGFLPTHVTQKALDRKVVPPVSAEIELPDGAALLSGKRCQELGQLSGRVLTHSVLGTWGVPYDKMADRAVAEWVVRAGTGSVLAFTAKHPRAGVVRTSLTLGSS